MSSRPAETPDRRPPEGTSPSDASNGEEGVHPDDLEPPKGTSCDHDGPPRVILDERAAEGEIVDRLLDARVDQSDFDRDNPEWRQLATRLIEYGYTVLVAWGVTGALPAKVVLYGGRRLPVGLRLTKDDSQALAAEVLMLAIEKFRTRSLPTWSTTGGASLRTYFVGCCLQVVGQVYEGWYRRELRPLPLDPGHKDDGRDSHRPDEEAEARVLLDQILADDPDLRRVLVLQDQGYSLEEIAQALDTTKAGLKSRIFRARRRIKNGGQVRG